MSKFQIQLKHKAWGPKNEILSLYKFPLIRKHKTHIFQNSMGSLNENDNLFAKRRIIDNYFNLKLALIAHKPLNKTWIKCFMLEKRRAFTSFT